jgi:dihydroflavonol-4-reductase
VRVLISGATGLLGNNLVRLALNRGLQVACLTRSVRKGAPFDSLDVDLFQADLADPMTLRKIFENRFDACIHCAAEIHIGWKFLDRSMRVNRDGTKILLEEAGRQGTKFVHVSTVNTLAVGSKEKIVDEETAGDGRVPCNYILSKMAAEKLADEAAAAGQQVVVVHPGFMLGPWDWKPSSGRMISGLQGFAPFAPSGGCSVCDPRDVAEAILNAIPDGISGRHYILAGENMTYLDLWRRICFALGKKGPLTVLRGPGRFAVGLIGDTISRFSRNELDINSAAIAIASQTQWYSSKRAMDELGYRPRPANESIRDAVQWLRQNHLM